MSCTIVNDDIVRKGLAGFRHAALLEVGRDGNDPVDKEYYFTRDELAKLHQYQADVRIPFGLSSFILFEEKDGVYTVNPRFENPEDTVKFMGIMENALQGRDDVPESYHRLEDYMKGLISNNNFILDDKEIDDLKTMLQDAAGLFQTLLKLIKERVGVKEEFKELAMDEVGIQRVLKSLVALHSMDLKNPDELQKFFEGFSTATVNIFHHVKINRAIVEKVMEKRDAAGSTSSKHYKDNGHDLYLLYNLNELNSGFEEFLKVVLHNLIDDKTSSVYKSFNRIFEDTVYVKQSYLSVGVEFLSEQIQFKYVDSKGLKRLEAQVQEAKDKFSRDPSEANRLRLEEMEKVLKDTLSSSDAVRDILEGRKGDANRFRALMQAAASNADPIINSLHRVFRSTMKFVNREKHIPTVDRFSKALDKLGLSALKITNVPKYMRDKFLRRRKKYVFDSKTNKVDSYDIWEFKHGVPIEYYEEREKRLAELSKLHADRREAFSARDTRKQSSLELKLLKAQRDFIKFEIAAGVHPVSDDYYEHTDEINKDIEKFYATYGEDPLYLYSTLSNEIALLDGQLISMRTAKLTLSANAEIVEKKKELYREQQQLRSVDFQSSELKDKLISHGEDMSGIKSSSEILDLAKSKYPNLYKEYKVIIDRARVLSKYFYLKFSKDEWVTKDDDRDFDGEQLYQNDMSELRKARSNNEISLKEYQDMVQELSNTEFVNRTNDRTLREDIKDIRLSIDESLQSLNKEFKLTRKLSDISFWERVFSLERSYREGSEVHAKDMPDHVIDSIKDLQTQASEDYEIYQLAGLNDPDYIELSLKSRKAYEEFYITNDLAELSILTSIANEKQQKEAGFRNTLTQAQRMLLDKVIAEVDVYREELAKIRTSEVTDSYHLTYTEKRRSFAINGDPTIGVTKFRDLTKLVSGRDSYTVIAGEWVNDDTFVIVDREDILDLYAEKVDTKFRSQRNGWFIRNHIFSVDYHNDPRYTPLTSWRKTVPKDLKVYQEVNTPGRGYMIQVPKQQYRVALNKDSRFDEMVIPTKVDASYKADLTTPELEFLDFLLEESRNAQENNPNDYKMYYEIPRIERENHLLDIRDYNKKGIQDKAWRSIFSSPDDFETGSSAGGDLVDLDPLGRRRIKPPNFFTTDVPADNVETNVWSSVMKYTMVMDEQHAIYENTDADPSFALFGRVLEDVLSEHEPGDPSKSGIDYIKTWGRFLGKDKAAKGMLSRLPKAPHPRNKRAEIVSKLLEKLLLGQVHQDLPVEYKIKKGWTLRVDKLIKRLQRMRGFQMLGGLFWQSAVLTRDFVNMSNWYFQVFRETFEQTDIRYFSKRNLHKSILEYTYKDSTGLLKDWGTGRIVDKSFLGRMLDYFDVLEGNLVDEAGKPVFGGALRTLLSSDFFFMSKNASELFNAAVTFKTYMYGVKVKNETTGDVVSLYKAFEKNVSNGSVQLPSYYKNLDGSDIDISNHMERIQDAIRITNGAYAKYDRSLASDTIWGQGFEFMKRWMVEFVMARWKPREWNPHLQSWSEGYHRSVIRYLKSLFVDGHIVSSLANLNADYIRAKHMLPHERANLAKAFWVNLMLLLLYFVTQALFDFDDEDEDKYKTLKKQVDRDGRFWGWAMYWSTKLNAELTATSLVGVNNGELLRLYDDLKKSVIPVAFDEKYWNVGRSFLKMLVHGNPVTGKNEEELLKNWGVNLSVDAEGVKFEEGDSKFLLEFLKMYSFLKQNREDPVEMLRGFHYGQDKSK